MWYNKAKEGLLMKKVRLLVSGRVQGVGFRYATYALALDMGDIYGRVWNNSDGTVEILVQSKDSDKIAKFIQEVRKGPSKWAKVTYVDVTMANFEDFQDFRISN
ncbi:K01512 acylphosphatase [Streptococcus dysgalactiae subsp. equisimilis AC-2713]|uniref:acylphosphatase n=3 Tax=Streptococcus dysgalactiae TaxID=1334 RepID=A0AB33R3K1_STREQ|nr:acylphosphatase [Streptococcus dysgalactiae subsp. equisimilis GGS_124]BAM60556.1 acylphosphatase [Streptococcus dysgalactiae subsp. equisimilis RE378]CCI61924.1 K01512 acylphosphatase [Streptococcus dysgalactiae subsp. equisimilis AC-2713]